MLLYFQGMDHILTITNKMNIIFQANYCTAHMLYKDGTEMLRGLISIYMKMGYIQQTNIETIDPRSSVNYKPIDQIYLGVKVAKTILTFIPAEKSVFSDFLINMREFVIILCEQLKSRLPLSDFFKSLRFVDPQIAVYNEFPSLYNVTSKFPQIIKSDEEAQQVDSEYQNLKFDSSVSDLLASGSSEENKGTTSEGFWTAVSKMRNGDGTLKYQRLSLLVNSIMALPISNTACERIFSQVNLVKTERRNRFGNDHISAILQVKDGIKEATCVNFCPSRKMIVSASDSKKLYNNVPESD